MKARNRLELLRRLRILPVGKDRPVTLPPALFAELVSAAMMTYVDEAWYLERYPDVAGAIAKGTFASAAEHFAVSGLMEGRMPCPVDLDVDDYLQRHRDVAKAVEAGKLVSAAEHFYTSGFFEGRGYNVANQPGTDSSRRRSSAAKQPTATSQDT